MSEPIKRYLLWGGNPPKMVEHAIGGYVDFVDYARIVSEREAAAREKALEEACRAVCVDCRIGRPAREDRRDSPTGWSHGYYAICNAGGIRSLMQQPGDTA